MSRKKALILSGGGGRGAYHVGVIEALVAHGWMEDGKGPDIIAGTSIGAINAAALASGSTVAQLRDMWLHLHTEDVQRLSDDLPGWMRPLLSFFMGPILTSNGHSRREELPPDILRHACAHLIERLAGILGFRPFRSFLDTSPLRQTLHTWIDEERMNCADAPALLLTAVDVQRGTLRTFCNRDRVGQPRDQIAVSHLLASSSIPLMYPWTEIGQSCYWDGAVTANTPLGPVIELAGDDELDIVVVMMTPWSEDEAKQDAVLQPLPQNIPQAVNLVLDWSMLASYRSELRQLRRDNQFVQHIYALVERTGDTSLLPPDMPRSVNEPMIIAPDSVMPMEWIVDYEPHNHEALFVRGFADAKRALVRPGIA